jgi:hypothetical protein
MSGQDAEARIRAWVENHGPHPTSTIVMLAEQADALRAKLWHAHRVQRDPRELLLLVDLEQALARAVHSRPAPAGPYRQQAP